MGYDSASDPLSHVRRHCIPEHPVPGRIADALCPAIREALESLALCWSEAADDHVLSRC